MSSPLAVSVLWPRQPESRSRNAELLAECCAGSTYVRELGLMDAQPHSTSRGDSREPPLAESIQEVVVASYAGQPEAEM